MVRIAEIQFSGNPKTYDYFCNDTSIVEGDVVFVEGCEEPVFVYSIREGSFDPKCKAEKNVIKKAKENPNVIVESRYMNIIKCDCECIVNSLGPQTDIFGAICKSIVNEAKSDDINSMLKNNPNANIFKIFVTDAGMLPSKHVIHIVMPFKAEDEHNKNLKKAFSMVIDEALSLGYESIGIPYIGTGANGYDPDDIAKAMNTVLFKYQYKEDIKIKIVSIVYNATGDSARLRDREMENYTRVRIRESRRRMERETNPNFYVDELRSPSDLNEHNMEKSYYYSDTKTEFILDALETYYNGHDEYEIDNSIHNPVDYIRRFKKEKKLFDISVEFQEALSYSNQTKVTSGERQIKKKEVINLAIACRMNFTEFVQFMLFSGFFISTNSKDDIEIALLQYLIDNKRFKGLKNTYTELAYHVSNKAIDAFYPQENY